jgi:hypothetical protein
MGGFVGPHLLVDLRQLLHKTLLVGCQLLGAKLAGIAIPGLGFGGRVRGLGSLRTVLRSWRHTRGVAVPLTDGRHVADGRYVCD